MHFDEAQLFFKSEDGERVELGTVTDMEMTCTDPFREPILVSAGVPAEMVGPAESASSGSAFEATSMETRRRIARMAFGVAMTMGTRT